MKNTAFKTTIALALLFTAFTFAADIVSVDAASAVASTAADTAKSTGIYNQIIDWYNDNLNYGTITLLMAIESSFIPFPSELVVPPAAYKALQPGSGLNIALIVFFATLGALIGEVEKAENYFREHGAISTFVGRLITVIRQLISIPAGLAKMKLAPFTLYTFLGAAIWNCVLALLGYFAHGQKDIIEKYNSELAIALLGFGVLFIGYMVWNAMKPKKKQ